MNDMAGSEAPPNVRSRLESDDAASLDLSLLSSLNAAEQIIFVGKIHGITDAEIATHLEMKGHHHQANTILNHFNRIARIVQDEHDELLNAGIAKWHEGEDHVLLSAYTAVSICAPEQVRADRFQYVANKVNASVQFPRFSAKACEHRYQFLEQGKAEPSANETSASEYQHTVAEDDTEQEVSTVAGGGQFRAQVQESRRAAAAEYRSDVDGELQEVRSATHIAGRVTAPPAEVTDLDTDAEDSEDPRDSGTDIRRSATPEMSTDGDAEEQNEQNSRHGTGSHLASELRSVRHDHASVIADFSNDLAVRSGPAVRARTTPNANYILDDPAIDPREIMAKCELLALAMERGMTKNREKETKSLLARRIRESDRSAALNKIYHWLRRRGLPTHGNRAELIWRLAEFDATRSRSWRAKHMALLDRSRRAVSHMFSMSNDRMRDERVMTLNDGPDLGGGNDGRAMG